jgi:hypothetical protein
MTFIINPFAFKQILGEGGLLKVTQLVVENLSLVIPLAPEPISIETYPLEVTDFSILYIPAKVSGLDASSSPLSITQLEVYDTNKRPAGWPNQEPSDVFARVSSLPSPVSDIKLYRYDSRPAGEEPYGPPSDIEVVNLHPLIVTDFKVMNLSSNDRDKNLKTDGNFLYPLRSSDVVSVQKNKAGNISRGYPKFNVFLPKAKQSEKVFGALNLIRKYINIMLFEGEDKVLEENRTIGTPLVEFLPNYNANNGTHIVLDFSYSAYDADLAASGSGLYESSKALGVSIKSTEINEGINSLLEIEQDSTVEQKYSRLNYAFSPDLDTEDSTYKFFRKSLTDALFEIVYGEGAEDIYTWHNYFGINQDGTSPNLWEYGYSFYEQKDNDLVGIAKDIATWLNFPKYPKDNIFSVSNISLLNDSFNVSMDANITGRSAIFDPSIQGGVRYTQSSWKIELSEDPNGATLLVSIDLGPYLPSHMTINQSDFMRNELQYLAVHESQTLNTSDALYITSASSDIKILDFTSRSSANPSVISQADSTLMIYEESVNGNNTAVSTLNINPGIIIKLDYKKLISRGNDGIESFEANNSQIYLRVIDVVYLYNSVGEKFVKISFEEISVLAGKSKLYANLLAAPATGYESYEKEKDWVEITRSSPKPTYLTTEIIETPIPETLTIATFDTEQSILSRTGDDTGTIAYGTDTNDLYILNSNGWAKFEND